MGFGKAEGHGLFGFDACVDPGVLQRGEVGFGIGARQVALEGNGAAAKELLDGLNVAFEQFGEIQFSGGAFDTREQGSIKHNLETVVAHAGILVTLQGEGGQARVKGGPASVSARPAQLCRLLTGFAVFGIQADNEFIDAG